MAFEFTKAAAIFRRRAALWLCFASLCFGLQAQEPAVVTFTLDFPGSQPDQYVISISSDGHSTYDSNSKLSEYCHHYHKLARDEELKRLEDRARQHGLEELQVSAPILQRVAEDASVINPVRARAQRLLRQAAVPRK